MIKNVGFINNVNKGLGFFVLFFFPRTRRLMLYELLSFKEHCEVYQTVITDQFWWSCDQKFKIIIEIIVKSKTST